MLVKQTSLSLVGSRFLGSKDHVLLAGNVTNHVGRLQINYCQYKNEVDGMLTLNAVADSVIHQQISCMEVICIPRVAKSYIAVAGQSAQDHGALSFVNIEMNKQGATMSLDSLDVFNQNFGIENFPRITSMSFLAERELLAIATEAGDISLLDLYSRKHLMTIRADATGINKIEFTPAGQIVCVGNSVETPMKIFDIRQNDRESSITPAMSYTRKQSQHSYKAVSNDMDIVDDSDPYARVYNRSLSLRAPGYTTVTSHPSQAAVIAGDTNGNIVHWDLRTKASIEYNPHGSVVNDVLVHPHHHDWVVSCSNDGSAKIYDTSTVNTEYKTLIQEGMKLTSLSADQESAMFMITSEFGQAWRLPLSSSH